jgi:hypothetical protein
MTESDLRVANTRLESGGEVNPYTARHMGLFVVSRLAAQHGLVVRLRSTIAGEPDSGTTAGVHVSPDLIAGMSGADQHDAPDQVIAVAAHAGATAASALPDRQDAEPGPNGYAGLPQRSPGASGISGIPGDDGPDGSEVRVHQAPTDTSAFFAARAQVADDGDAIYQSMVSEWLIDPTEIARSSDLNWEFVWDYGWSAAEAAESAPVDKHTDDGLPLRDPGARLVPGAVDGASRDNGRPNGDGHQQDQDESRVGPAPHPQPRRDPDAVRASIGSHFGGVQAGRLHTRQTKGTENE